MCRRAKRLKRLSGDLEKNSSGVFLGPSCGRLLRGRHCGCFRPRPVIDAETSFLDCAAVFSGQESHCLLHFSWRSHLEGGLRACA
eukprot:1793689-Pyramimonas_sp.AAC.1